MCTGEYTDGEQDFFQARRVPGHIFVTLPGLKLEQPTYHYKA
jgi:hypothetical protein